MTPGSPLSRLRRTAPRVLATGAVAALLGISALHAQGAPSRLVPLNPLVVLHRDASCGAPSAPPATASGEDPILPGRLILVLREGSVRTEGLRRDGDGCLLTGISSLDAVAHGLRVREVMAPPSGAPGSAAARFRLVRYDADVDPREAASWLAGAPEIASAEPDRLRFLDATPGDLSYPAQWNLPAVNAPRAWDLTTGSADAVLAIVDSGLERTHPDLAPNVWTNAAESSGSPGVDDDGNGFTDDLFGWDFVTATFPEIAPGEDAGPPDADPSDGYGHGTEVAGIAAAATGNFVPFGAADIVGVCPGCRIMGLRAGYLRDGPSPTGVVDLFASIQAIVYAADNGADVINMSYTGALPSPAEAAALDYARGRGIVLVAAAGNTNDPGAQVLPVYPAAYPGVIAVAAVDATDIKASFSRYGPWVDISAPGVGVLTTRRVASHGTVAGTSFAAPHVAAAAGLIRSLLPAATAGAVEEMLVAGAAGIDDLNPAFAGGLGAGRLDLFRSLVAGRLGVENAAGDPNAESVAYRVTGVAVAPGAPWLSFAAPLPLEVAPGEIGFLDPIVDDGPAACGENAASVAVATDDPASGSLEYQVRMTLDCDVDRDGSLCAARGGDDCDDGNSSIGPGRPEVCDGPAACEGTGGEDEDCDGAIDEICSCSGRPNAPAAVTASAAGGGVLLAWEDLSDNEEGFRIFRRRSGGWVRVGVAGPDARSFLDTGPAPGKAYVYSVRAFNRRGISPRARSGVVVAP